MSGKKLHLLRGLLERIKTAKNKILRESQIKKDNFEEEKKIAKEIECEKIK